MDDPEYTFQILEVFSKVKSKEIPRELEEYISYVARTGDPVFQWSLVRVLIKEKLVAVLNEFVQETEDSINIPTCPNVEVFNYETMKTSLLNRLDSFILPPFTIQRICELLAAPRKEYNRIDKYMRAVEKNFLVVSASEYSLKRGLDTDGSDAVINGIPYDKVNDPLNSFSNHVLSHEQENEMNAPNKLDETDAVQQIIDESWNEEDGEAFKINGSDNSSLDVSFDNELRFVTDKSTDEKDGSCDESSEELDSSFDDSSMMIEPTIQNIIAESSNISFENASKSESSFEDSPMKNDATFEFKDESSVNECENSIVEAEVFDLSCNEATRVPTASGVSCDSENEESVNENDESKHTDYEDFSQRKTDNLESSEGETRSNDYLISTKEAIDDEGTEVVESNLEDRRCNSSVRPSEITSENTNSSLPESQEKGEEPALCAGDSEKIDLENKDVEQSTETIADQSKSNAAQPKPSEEA